MRDVRCLGEICSNRTSIGFRRFIQLFEELLHIREVLVNGPFEEMQESSVVDGLRIHKLGRRVSMVNVTNWISTNFVDAANTETERATFNSSTIHIVTDHEDELEGGQQQSLSMRAKLTLSTSLNCLACSNASLA